VPSSRKSERRFKENVYIEATDQKITPLCFKDAYGLGRHPVNSYLPLALSSFQPLLLDRGGMANIMCRGTCHQKRAFATERTQNCRGLSGPDHTIDVGPKLPRSRFVSCKRNPRSLNHAAASLRRRLPLRHDNALETQFAPAKEKITVSTALSFAYWRARAGNCSARLGRCYSSSRYNSMSEIFSRRVCRIDE
jgi:hypothetical protein